MDAFKKGMRGLADGLKRVAEEVDAAERGEERPGVNVNVQRRTNVRVVTNVGRPGSVAGASAEQHAPIHQRAGKSRRAGKQDA
jgi:protein involved in polysaccharide export with SLBB domain